MGKLYLKKVTFLCATLLLFWSVMAEITEKREVNEYQSNQPKVTLKASKTEFLESESVEITATLSSPATEEVVIDLGFSGTATFGKDYVVDFSTKGPRTVAGGKGEGGNPDQVSSPTAITIDKYGNLFISDGNGKITKWSPGATQGEFLKYHWSVRDLHIDESGNIYVLEEWNSRVIKYLPGSTEGTVVAGSPNYQRGNNANELNQPRGMFIDTFGNIYIADWKNHRIQKWVPGAKEGETVAGGNGEGGEANQLNHPSAVWVNEAGDLFIADQYNHRIQKWTAGSSSGITVWGQDEGSWIENPEGVVMDAQGYLYSREYSRIKRLNLITKKDTVLAGGWDSGAGDFQFRNPQNFKLDPFGNIYIADHDNHRIQLYQNSPQIVIPIGETSGKIVVNGIQDGSYEGDENIYITARAIRNATINQPELTLVLVDQDEIPQVAFELSKDRISIGADEPLTISAWPSVPAGKDIIVSFSVGGDASQEFYEISDQVLIIPANKASGSINISTNGKSTNAVDVIRSIELTITEIENALTDTHELKVFLVNENKPLFSVQISKETIAEHESTEISGTLSAPTSRDVLIDLTLAGSAVLGRNFEAEFETKGPHTVAGGKGEGNNPDQLNYPTAVATDKDGNIYVSSQNGAITKWSREAEKGELLFQSGGGVVALQLDDKGSLYTLQNWGARVTKYDLISKSEITVAGSGNRGSNSTEFNYPHGMFVDKQGNIYIADSQNHRVQKWSKGASEGVTVAGGNGDGNRQNQLNHPTDVFVDREGYIYIADQYNYRIQKWKEGSSEGETYLGGNVEHWITRPNKITFDQSGHFYVLEYNSVKKFLDGEIVPSIVAGESYGSEVDQLRDPQGMFVDNSGNIFIADFGNHRVQKYQYAPQIFIPAGETTGTVVIQGIDDDINEEDKVLNISVASAINAVPAEDFRMAVTIMDNTKNLTLKDNPFIGLSKGAVAWGDFDNDGDMDVAVMGQSATAGAVTRLYENVDGTFEDTNQNFVRLFDGDISWVDINKDGWIDLVVSGFNNGPQTKVYINREGKYFEPTDDYGLPQLFSTKMAWGDLDNDGDIDLAIAGIDASDNYVFQVYYKNDTSERFDLEPEFNYEGFIKGDLKIVDVDLDGDNDIVYSGESKSGYPIGQIINNSFIKTGSFYNNNYWHYDNLLRLKKSSIQVDNILGGNRKRLTIVAMGEDSERNLKFLSSDQLQIQGSNNGLPNLVNGNMAIGDFNNDGYYDIVFTGEDDKGIPVAKLFIQTGQHHYYDEAMMDSYAYGYFEESDIKLIGLRESTVQWVDYDMDGDLDLFMTGIDAQGVARTILYESELRNKKNTAPQQPANLKVVDLGNGRVRFSWDAPNDDFSKDLGYILRLGTTPGGTELSNTESNFETGMRLISKPAPIYSTSFETQLDPGQYFWSVQGVDTGLMGGEFSDESSFTLTYDWKIMNQGGIVDRSIQGRGNAVLKLADLTNNNYLDLIFGSNLADPMAWWGDLEVYKFDGKRLVRDLEPTFFGNNVIDAEVGDINGDGVVDVLISHVENNNFVFRLYVSNGNGNYEVYEEPGLFRANARFVDLNNDGKSNIVLAGLSSSTTAGSPRLWVYEYRGSGMSLRKTDLSNKIASLKFSSFDFGDFDNDSDIDFVITGFNDMEGLQSFLYENATELGGDFQLNPTDNNIVPVRDGTIDFIDFDGDGDLDLVVTGSGEAGDVFEIYMNRLNEGYTTWPRINLGLVPIRNGKIDLGDFNGDGYADLLYSGLSQGEGKITRLAEYDPVSQKYKESEFDVSDITDATVEFGDLDGDGDLDFVISGESRNNNGEYVFRAYLNVRTESAKVLEQAGGGENARVSNSYVINKAPTEPVTKEIQLLTDVNVEPGTHAVEFSWNPSEDDFTPSAGLTYALKVGTTPGGEEVMSSNANANGMRKSAGKGNVEHNLKWKLSLKPGNYYWSVQAIDASYLGSTFSAPRSFKVSSDGIKYAPVMDNQDFFIEEFSENGTSVGKIAASHPDKVDFKFKLVSGNEENTFEVDAVTGEIKVANTAGLDLTKRERFSLVVEAEDINGAKTQATINIRVLVNYGEDAIVLQLDGGGYSYLSPQDFISNFPENGWVNLSQSDFGCNDLGDQLIVGNVYDQYGNETRVERKVTIVDNIKPTVRGRNLQLTLDDSGEAFITPADIDDESFDNCGIASWEISKHHFTIKDAGENRVVFTVKDESGNSSSMEVTVSVDVILSAGQNRESDAIKLYPNPAHQEIHIEFLNEIGKNLRGIQITDTNGRLINEVNVTGLEGKTLSFDISELASGTYFVRMQYSNMVKVMRFVKIH